MEKSVSFMYGMLGEPLEEQANKQGFTLGKDAEFLEKLRVSTNMCGFHLATESQAKQMFAKLHKKVIKVLKIIE